MQVTCLNAGLTADCNEVTSVRDEVCLHGHRQHKSGGSRHVRLALLVDCKSVLLSVNGIMHAHRCAG